MDSESPFAKCESGVISESGQIRLNVTAPMSSAANVNPESASPSLDSLLPLEDTFAMIKPVTSEMHAAEIFAAIAGQGFQIVQQLHTKLTLQQAEMFYAEHRGKGFFAQLTEYMSSGPVIALHLRRVVAIAGWRNLIGPTNLDKAKETRPDSLRAKFGIDGTRNACHGSDSRRSASREISFFFSAGGVPPEILPLPEAPEMSSQMTPESPSLSPVRPPRAVKPLSPAHSPSKLTGTSTVPKISRTDIALMHAYANYEVDPIMKNLLQKLMISRPDDVVDFAIRELNDIKRNPSVIKRSSSLHTSTTTAAHRYDDGDGSIATLSAEPSVERLP
jgi:nucleoside diphosphate kinase homolog 5